MGGWDQNRSYGDWLGGGGVVCVQLTQERDRWRAPVNTMINLLVLAPQSYG
jgi:hypothetical protein